MRRNKKVRLNRSLGGNLSINIMLIFFGAIMILPMVYSVSSALKPLEELWIFPPRFLPRNPTLQNFSDLFRLLNDSWVPFSRYLFNTMFVAVVGTAGNVVLGSMCAFAMSKMEFPGRKLFFRMAVLSLMFTSSVTSLPNFIILSGLGWIDSYWALIIPTFSSSLGLYLMKQFMDSMLPDTVLESAKIDGASDMLTFWKIVMPIVKPAWLTLIIFSFQGLWNMGSTIYIYSENLKPLNYAMQQILTAGVSRQGAAAAAAVIMMIVPIIVFVMTQSNVVETMATSGMKD